MFVFYLGKLGNRGNCKSTIWSWADRENCQLANDDNAQSSFSFFILGDTGESLDFWLLGLRLFVQFAANAVCAFAVINHWHYL